MSAVVLLMTTAVWGAPMTPDEILAGADARIEQHRRGDAVVKLLPPEGQSLSADVTGAWIPEGSRANSRAHSPSDPCRLIGTSTPPGKRGGSLQVGSYANAYAHRDSSQAACSATVDLPQPMSPITPIP